MKRRFLSKGAGAVRCRDCGLVTRADGRGSPIVLRCDCYRYLHEVTKLVLPLMTTPITNDEWLSLLQVAEDILLERVRLLDRAYVGPIEVLVVMTTRPGVPNRLILRVPTWLRSPSVPS